MMNQSLAVPRLCARCLPLLLLAWTLTAGSVPRAAAQVSAPNPLPFDKPSVSGLRASPKKVFGHYFTPFIISLDNKDPSVDYYTLNYLAPDGEGGKHLATGGFLRERPLPRAPRPEPNPIWREKDMDEEVRRAIAVGLDGFVLDLLGPPSTPAKDNYNWDRAVMLVQAAHRVDPGFQIILMPDMTAGYSDLATLSSAIRKLSVYPATYHLPDGRLVVSPYIGNALTPQQWQDWMASMSSEGIKIALLPLFQGWEKYAKDYTPVSIGMSDWGTRSPGANKGWRDVPARAHTYSPLWMMPVAPQDMRPKNLLYTEAGNSENFRVMWENAILGGADWVQLITWNDYSESTELSPSTGTQWAFNDLTAYYTTWFKTGTQPKITRDALFYFHRIEPTTAQPDLTKQAHPFTLASGSDAPRDEIELLAFLTRPGTLQIQIGNTTAHMAAPTGMTSFRVPLTNGTPVFRLLRAGKTIASVTSAFPISDQIVYQDLLYRAGSSRRPAVTMERQMFGRQTPAQRPPEGPHWWRRGHNRGING